ALNLRLLLVEDHVPTLDVMSRLLKRAGHSVRTASSVADGLALANQEPFDLVISDLGLPDGPGYALMREIRRQHGLPGIALSGFGMETDLQESREAGFVTHLVKPVDIADLSRAINAAVKHRSSTGAQQQDVSLRSC
ncbi:MAG TPA: response regulator, partial [Chthoniobacteraceae bacterium]